MGKDKGNLCENPIFVWQIFFIRVMIIDKIKAGCKDSFRELFSDYYPILCCFAENFLNDRDLSKDVAQEALLKYWEQKENFSNINQVKSFLYTVTKNMSLNILKRAGKISDLEHNCDISSDFDLQRSVIEHETLLMVRKAVSSLPDRMREIVELTMSGAQNSDIAERLGIAEGTVHSLKKRAYKKLKSVLGSHFCYLLMI